MKVAHFTHQRGGVQSFILLLATLCLLLATVTAARAQELSSAPQTAPPPMKFVSRDERNQLAATRDRHVRTRTSLEFAESHLHRAEELSIAHQYDTAAEELGNYQGVIEEALRFLDDNGKNSGKARDLYKKIELTLRAQAPRIETIRRTTPYEYAVNVKGVVKFTREARTIALNAFYGDTVMREDHEAETTAPDHTKDADTEKKAP